MHLYDGNVAKIIVMVYTFLRITQLDMVTVMTGSTMTCHHQRSCQPFYLHCIPRAMHLASSIAKKMLKKFLPFVACIALADGLPPVRYQIACRHSDDDHRHDRLPCMFRGRHVKVCKCMFRTGKPTVCWLFPVQPVAKLSLKKWYFRFCGKYSLIVRMVDLWMWV